MHGDPAAENSSSHIPLSCTLQILWSTQSAFEQGTETPHRVSIPQIGGLAVPSPGGSVVLRKADTGFPEFAETTHRARAASLGCVAVPIHSGRQLSGLAKQVGKSVHR